MTSLLRPLRALPRPHLRPQRPHAAVAHRRTFIPPLSSFVNAVAAAGSAGKEAEDEVTRYHERKVLPYGQKQLYGIVTDILSYPQFIPYCKGARILSGPVERSVPSSSSPTPTPTPPSSGTSTASSPAPSAPAADTQQETELETQAELEIGFLGVRERYTSRVLARPFRSVQASAIGGDNPMFKTLVTTWRFEPVPAPGEQPSSTGAKEQAGPTLLTLDLEYSFLNPLHAALAGAFFEKVSGMMVDAFERRCEVVYGPGKSPVTPDAVKMREVELVQK